jgi:hypothetical protein
MPLAHDARQRGVPRIRVSGHTVAPYVP